MFKEINTLKPFLEQPNREYHVRELARILKINPATASKKLKNFTRQHLLKHRKERMLDLYKANTESPIYRDLKIYYIISKIRQSGLIESLNEQYHKPTIILFGSASKGWDTEASDIDLVVISENKKEFSQQKEFVKRLGKELQIFVVGELKELKNKHLIQNVLNGITLQGEIR